MPTDDDWRLNRQETYLQGATLVWKPYRIWSEAWEHDHCAFCWRKFVDSAAPVADRDALTFGFAAVGAGPKGEDDYHWICETCANDFASRFRWTLVREAGI